MEDAVTHDMALEHNPAQCHCVRCRPLERPCGCEHCEAFVTSKPAKFKVGDRVIWTNDYGVCWGERTITEVGTDKWGHTYYFTPTETPWMHTREKNLEPAPPEPPPSPESKLFGSW